MKEPSKRFEYVLARDLGMTHRAMTRGMSAREFNRWAGLYRLESAEMEKVNAKSKRDSGTRRLRPRRRRGRGR